VSETFCSSLKKLPSTDEIWFLIDHRPGLNKGGPQEIFQTLKMCPNIPNFLKIAEKHFSHQNKYF
jgi:hypothetical protein